MIIRVVLNIFAPAVILEESNLPIEFCARKYIQSTSLEFARIRGDSREIQIFLSRETLNLRKSLTFMRGFLILPLGKWNAPKSEGREGRNVGFQNEKHDKCDISKASKREMRGEAETSSALETSVTIHYFLPCVICDLCNGNSMLGVFGVMTL